MLSAFWYGSYYSASLLIKFGGNPSKSVYSLRDGYEKYDPWQGDETYPAPVMGIARYRRC